MRVVRTNAVSSHGAPITIMCIGVDVRKKRIGTTHDASFRLASGLAVISDDKLSQTINQRDRSEQGKFLLSPGDVANEETDRYKQADLRKCRKVFANRFGEIEECFESCVNHCQPNVPPIQFTASKVKGILEPVISGRNG